MKNTFITLTIIFLLSACTITEKENTTLVYINNGSIQCGELGKSGLETANILQASNISVESTQCGHLANIAVVAMCGGPGININVHEIKSADLKKARSIGFEDVAKLKQENHKGYEVSGCK